MTGYTLNRRDVLKAAGVGVLGSDAVPAAARDRVADGPTVYVGTRDGTLHAVDAETGGQAWTFDETESWIHSSPTVVDGTVYVGQGRYGRHPGALYAVDAATGGQEWVFTEPGAMPGSPTVVDGTVYVGSQDETLYAVDATSGEKEWSTGVQDWDTDGSGWIRTAPAVDDGTVYVGANLSLHAIDAATGDTEWSFDEFRMTMAASPTVADGVVYLGSTELYAVDAETGTQVWNFDELAGVTTSSTVVDGTVYVGAYASEALYAIDAETGELEWSFDEPTDWVGSSPTVFGGTVYVGAGSNINPDDTTLYAVDAETGDPEWSFDGPTEGVLSSPTVFDVSAGSGGSVDSSDGGTVYVGSDDGTMYAVDAATGEPKWATAETEWSVASSPTVVADPSGGHSAGSRMVLGTLGHHHEWASAPAAVFFEVTIASTAVRDGMVEVEYAVENLGTLPGEGTIDVLVDDQEYDSVTVELDSGATRSGSITYVVQAGDAPDVTVEVRSDDDDARTAVDVEPSNVGVRIDGTNAPIDVGDELAVATTVENHGDEPVGPTIELVTPAGQTADGESVALGAGERAEPVLRWTTGEGDAGDVEITVRSPDDEASTTVTVEDPTSEDVPGPGIVGTLAGLGGAGYLLARRTGDEDDP